MSVPEALLADPSVVGPLGSLSLSHVRPGSTTLALRALRWHEGLERLGVTVPFVIVHDLGLLFAAGRGQYMLGARVPPATFASRWPEGARLLDLYGALLDEIGQSEAVARAGELRMSDDLVIVVLARLLGSVASRIGARPAYRANVPVDASFFEDLDAQLPAMFVSTGRAFETAALQALEVSRLFVLTMTDALDLDTLRLFGMLGSEANAGALAQVDLLAALESPEANDIVNFSLEILPSVLETKTRAAAGTTAAHGYSGIGTRGSIDSLVLSELAWDDLELARRLLDNEVLFYAREQARDEQRRVHHLLVDGSASMRGDRQTFARGLAIATGKKLLLEGEDVAFRFFDSRLYEVHRARHGQLPTAYLLSFKGERGRNPARVFAELSTELELARHSDPRTPVVHLFTHAALYIPREMVLAVKTHAHVSAVFILPSGGKLDLDYLDLLDGYWVVDHATLAQGAERADAARSILDDAQSVRHAMSAADGAPISRSPTSQGGGARSQRGGVPPRSTRTP